MNFETEDYQKNILKNLILNENFIIAEIYRISEIIPTDFIQPTSSKFNKVIIDFTFFENKAVFEKFVDETEEGKRLDQEFYNYVSDFLANFLNLLNAICEFIFEFIAYTERCSINQNVLDKRFIELNVLKSEVLYLLGIILLLLEEKFPGNVKERIFIAFYRSGAKISTKDFELLISLLRNRKEPFEMCFMQIKLNSNFVNLVINFLKSYSTLEVANFSDFYYSNEKLALMMYTCLYFKQDLLFENFAFMRQIVDKYFADKWMISLHLELQINLLEKWEHFKAANLAISNAIQSSLIVSLATERTNLLRNLQLPSRLLSISNLGDYSKLIIEYNKCLRWCILHLTMQQNSQKKIIQLLNSINALTNVSESEIFSFLTKLATFEYKFYHSCQFIIVKKEKDFIKLKSKICLAFNQITTFLSNPFDNFQINSKLQQWLINIKDCVMNLDMCDSNSAQILEHLKTKIVEVDELHTGDHIILHQYFSIISNELDRLLNICLVDKIFLERLTQKTCSLYLYQFLKNQIVSLENLLKNDALAVKFLFFKISNFIPNLFFSVKNSKKCSILSNFYHKKLELRLKLIIQVIPRAIFAGMDELQKLFPVEKFIQIQKTNIKEIADLKRRRLLAKKTFELTKLSLGISEMCIKKLGSIEIDSKALLLEGFKKELYVKLKKIVEFKAQNILTTLKQQTFHLNCFCKAFLFFCEYIGINGIILWQETLHDLTNLMVKEVDMTNYEEVIPYGVSITKKYSTQMVTKTYALANLIDYILLKTNPNVCNYYFLCKEWWLIDTRSNLCFTTNFFTLIENWMPGQILICVRKMLYEKINNLMLLLPKELEKATILLKQLTKEKLIFDQKFINIFANSIEFLDLYKKLIFIFSKIGQLMIIEENIFFVLTENMKSKMEGIFFASQNFLQLTQSMNKINQNFTLPSECFNFLEQFVDDLSINKTFIKDSLNFTAILSIFVSIFLNNNISNKKTEQCDEFTVIYGLIKTLESFGLCEQFNVFKQIFIGELKEIANFKQMPYVLLLLNVSNIPDALIM